MAEIIDIKESRSTESESAEMEQQNNDGIPEENDDSVPPDGDTPKVEQADKSNETADDNNNYSGSGNKNPNADNDSGDSDNGEGETAPPPCDWKNASGDDDSRPDKDDENKERALPDGPDLSLRLPVFNSVFDAADDTLHDMARTLTTKFIESGELSLKIVIDNIGGVLHPNSKKSKVDCNLKPAKVSTAIHFPDDLEIVVEQDGRVIVPDDGQHQVTFDELKPEDKTPPATVTVDGTTGIVEHVDDGDNEPRDVLFPCEIDGCPFYAYDADTNGCGYDPVNSDDYEDIKAAVEKCGCTRPEVLQAYADRQVNKESDVELMETNVIKLKFIKGGKPASHEYIYYSNTAVSVGDTVEVNGKDGISKGIVTQINVPVSAIEPFKDKAKTIIGKIESEDK